MNLHAKPPTTENQAQQISSNELEALRSRFAGAPGESRDRRAHGALTVSDLAEAFGVKEADVQAHLDRLRREQAFSQPTRIQSNQKLLAGLAAVLFIAAGVIYKVTPHPVTDEEIDAKVEEIQQQARTRTKKVHYPLTQTVDLGPATPPRGFRIEMTTPNTTTRALGESKSKFMTAPDATAQLGVALQALFEKAKAAEDGSPHPFVLPKARPENFLIQQLAGGKMSYIANNSQGFIDGLPVGTETSDQFWTTRKQQLAFTAKGIVEGVWANQQHALGLTPKGEVEPRSTTPPSPGQITMPPPGFNIQLHGRMTRMSNGEGLALIPVSAQAVSKRLVLSLRDLLRQDEEPPMFATEEMKIADAKIPMPPWGEVTIMGPRGKIALKIPLGPSSQYPTAADVARASEKVLEEAGKQAARQVEQINSGS